MIALQLHPSYPVETPKGRGRAIILIDYSEDHHLFWVVAMDESGECWMFANPDIRFQTNPTLGTKTEAFARA